MNKMNKLIISFSLIIISTFLVGSNPEPSLTGKRKEPEPVSTTGSSTCSTSPSKQALIGQEKDVAQAVPVIPGPEIITIETSDNQELQWPKSIWSLSGTIEKFFTLFPDTTKIPLNVTLEQLNYIQQLLESYTRQLLLESSKPKDQIMAQLNSLKRLEEFNSIYALSDYLDIPVILESISAAAQIKGSEIAGVFYLILSPEMQRQKTQGLLNLFNDFKKTNVQLQQLISDGLVEMYSKITDFNSLEPYSLDRIMTPSEIIPVNGYTITFNKNGTKILLGHRSTYLPNDIYVWNLYPTPTQQLHLPISDKSIIQAAFNFEKNDEEIWVSTFDDFYIFSIAGEEKTHITRRDAEIIDYDFKNNQFVIRYNSDPNNIAVKNILNETINVTPEYIQQFSYGSNIHPNKHPFLRISQANFSNNVISYQLKDERSPDSTAHQITLPLNNVINPDFTTPVTTFITNTGDKFFLIIARFKQTDETILYALVKQTPQGEIKLYFFYADSLNRAADVVFKNIEHNDILVGYNSEQNILYYSPNDKLYALNLATADHAMSNIEFLKDASPIDRLLFFIAQLTRHESIRDQLLANPEIYEFIRLNGQKLFPTLYEQLNLQ